MYCVQEEEDEGIRRSSKAKPQSSPANTSQCDGKRPVCTSCANKQTSCDYIAEEKESHISALRRRNNELLDESDVRS